MLIKDMFEKNIQRNIDGVINVERRVEDAVACEIDEYVITRELKKHFTKFFNYYSDGFDTELRDTGVWISGFFGSGKSHFLKMLSYLLENKVVAGTSTVDRFRSKFESDPGTFMLVDKSTRGETDTILFDIDNVGMAKKDSTVVLRIFAKMFYNKIGFYGDNLKLAMLEKFIDEKGLTDRFRAVFEGKTGDPWESVRPKIGFFEDDVVETLQEVLGMSETAARHWFDSTVEDDELSIEKLVSEMADYVSRKPANYRLLFMIDEVGQYIGTDGSMLLNLQTLIEQIGNLCHGKVWVMCTGQEALDEIIKVRTDEFSRILGRFKVTLSLTSSSADEVIQKRILAKKDDAKMLLEASYGKDAATLKNLFRFRDQTTDIQGYRGPEDYAANYPFVPYQFIILQGVFTEVRKKGFAGKHMSGGERSMLSAFQDSAKAIMEYDDRALVPFWRFYDTLQTFLDSNIRMIIDRCERAALNNDDIEMCDVPVLKLLYLMKNMNDIPANLDNIMVLMTDSIDIDRTDLRAKLQGSLDRLVGQNYVSRAGDVYYFLTDDEQEIQRGINKITVPDSTITKRISELIYGDLYTTKKFRYGNGEFGFDQYVDSQSTGNIGNDMILRFLTLATDITEKSDVKLKVDSQGGQAIVVLADTGYYQDIESAQQIKLYTKTKNVAHLSAATQKIIDAQYKLALEYEESAKTKLIEAIQKATFYVAGEKLNITSGDAKAKIENAMNYLVSHVYSEYGLIDNPAKSDAVIADILTGSADDGKMAEFADNKDAVIKMEQFMEMRFETRIQTTMADVQERYRKKPYGWSEIDISCVMARLIRDQKVVVKYGGNTIQPSDSRLPSMLRLKSEIGKTSVSKRITVSVVAMKKAADILRSYFDCMDIPKDEDGLVRFIIDRFTAERNKYNNWNDRYSHRKYPEHSKLANAIALVDDVLSQQKDNIALIDRLNKNEIDLCDNKTDMANLEEFFNSQVGVFDTAVTFLSAMEQDRHYVEKDANAKTALDQIRLITTVPSGQPFKYKRIPELNGLMETVRQAHDIMVAEKKIEIMDVIRQCMEDIHSLAAEARDAADAVAKADTYYSRQKEEIHALDSIALIDARVFSLAEYKDSTCTRIEALKAPEKTPPANSNGNDSADVAPVKKVYKPVLRQMAFPAKCLETEAQIDAYVESLRKNLKMMLQGCDGIQIK